VSDEEEGADKPYDPTPKKLEDARAKGEVPRSTDLITTGSYAGLLLAGVAAGGGALDSMGRLLAGLIARAPELAADIGTGGGHPILGGVIARAGAALAAFALLPMGLALGSVVAQRAFTVTRSKLQPKLSRVSILSNARNKFGRNGLFEFAKSTVKMAIYTAILLWFLARAMPEILASVAMGPHHVTALLLGLCVRFLALVLLISVVIGSADFLWQRAEHLRKHRMSHKDMTDEQKQAEGDPMMKQQRRQRAQEIAMNQMLADLPGASVVVVNPTHFAVALKWSRADAGAPLCVAKGVDEVAATIRRMAVEHEVPIHEDPPTARALHATVEIGQEIRPEHFAAVAVAIRFAEEMRKKAADR